MCSMLDFSGGSEVKRSACQRRQHGFDPWSGKAPRACSWAKLTRLSSVQGASAPEARASELLLRRKKVRWAESRHLQPRPMEPEDRRRSEDPAPPRLAN